MFSLVKVKRWLVRSTCRCSCGLSLCTTETLVGAREYHYCKELGPARRILVFDGSIERIGCITDHKTVYTHVRGGAGGGEFCGSPF